MRPINILMLSIHGLIRGRDMELGRDADTGGQCLYVVEVARNLAMRPEVVRVDLLTRRVNDPQVSSDYAEPVEELNAKSRIVRIEAGPEGYIRKEELWDYLDSFADNALAYIRAEGLSPDIIHSHYADAGYVGTRLANLLGVPLVHTGHSLGRVKRRRLIASGMKRDVVESRYHMARRIEAEELTLGSASLVIASTPNEIEEQYELYDYYQPEQMRVIPPGTDLQRFRPPDGREQQEPIAAYIARFLREPDKPMILALSRADERKNIANLVRAYGESSELQRLANLVLVTGNRDDIRDLESGAQQVLNDLLLDIDRYDLYGRVAYPKHHRREEVPVLYRLAAASGGVFVNPALTEPFGLTLIEAAASGLPVVATSDGGPRNIIGNCQNGYLIDPLNPADIEASLLRVLGVPEVWKKLSQAGLQGVQEHYSWPGHAAHYLAEVKPLLDKGTTLRPARARRPMLDHDRALFTNLDQNLLGDPVSLSEFMKLVHANRKKATFGIVTGRSLESTLVVIRQYGLPMPNVLITNLGTEIHFAPEYTADEAWIRHIDHWWSPARVRSILDEVPGLKRQAKEDQSRFKISYYVDPLLAPSLEEIKRLLHQGDQTVNVTLTLGQYLDIVPMRASKGFAVRWFADTWGIPLEHVLVAGGYGSDEDMLRGNTLAVVPATCNKDVEALAGSERIYFAQSGFARGILEAIDYYDFYDACRAPQKALNA